MRRYRAPGGEERLWFERNEIEEIAESELRRSGLMPTRDAPAAELEPFLERHLGAILDQHAPLEPEVLGLTEFRNDEPPVVRINRDLTSSIRE